MEDYELEKVLKTVYRNEVPDHIKDNAEVKDYLNKLRSFKLDNLRKEQMVLSEETRQIEENTQDLAIKNYKTFIETADSSRTIFKEFSEISKNLDVLIEKLPNLTTQCETFVQRSSEINSALRLNSLTLKKHKELLEILELPQLMESCIREEKYEEALELAAYVQRLGVKFANVAVINNIVKTIEESWHVMLTQLLSQLKCDLQLPKCLQVVGYLRRMQAFSQSELKLKFLQTRDSWLKEILANIPRSDPQQHLTKTIEVTRINLFNIVTQYKAVFDDDKDSNLMFNSWLHDKIEEFLKTLEYDLSQSNSLIDISSTLGQSMYFGLSFSRIGFDFRGLIAPIFLKVIQKNLTSSMVKVTQQFELDIENFTLINKEAPLLKRTATKFNDGEEENNHPPETLMDFQPLAIYCNGLLGVFNELRICSPIAIVHSFVVSLEASLTTVAKNILGFYRGEQQAFGSKEKENFSKLCSCFAYDLIPFLQNCINLIFPSSKVAAYLGINLPTLQKEALTVLRNQKILEVIEHLLPDRVDMKV